MDLGGQEDPEPRVAYEDECLVAIVKPARMHSAPGSGPGELCAWAFERFPEARDAGSPERRRSGEGGLLHRLDFETSGLVLFARKAEAFSSLLDQQERGSFRKEYLAFARPSRLGPPGSRPERGFPRGFEGAAKAESWDRAREGLDSGALAALIDGASASSGPCGIDCAFRPYGPKGARVACLGPEADESKPVYASDILACGFRADGDASALELRLGLSRGFRHQLRAQLAWIGLPILGDPLYGGSPDGRLRLYAVRLSFAHPATGLPVSISAGT
jgi:23S rRNA pseudouridine1911/1915/1917 synthase